MQWGQTFCLLRGWALTDRGVPNVVDRWFGENTFHASEFSDIRKLVALKDKWDPDNLFRVNQNIKPARP